MRSFVYVADFANTNLKAVNVYQVNALLKIIVLVLFVTHIIVIIEILDNRECDPDLCKHCKCSINLRVLLTDPKLR